MARTIENKEVIIICGARRTGTTLMNQILCCDPSTHAHVGETRLLSRLIEVYRWAKDAYPNSVQWYFKDETRFREYFDLIVSEFMQNAHEALHPKEKFVFKAPAFSPIVADVMELIDSCRFLVCVRHPFDQVASDLEVGLKRSERDGGIKNRATSRNVASFARAYLKHYEAIMSAAVGSPSRFLFCKYEDLLNDLDPELEKIEAFFGLDLSSYDPKSPWKDFLNQSELQKMPAHVPQYGAPLDTSRVNRYRDVLNPEELDVIRHICDPIISRFYTE